MTKKVYSNQLSTNFHHCVYSSMFIASDCTSEHYTVTKVLLSVIDYEGNIVNTFNDVFKRVTVLVQRLQSWFVGSRSQRDSGWAGRSHIQSEGIITKIMTKKPS